MSRAAELDVPALALTDHGVLYGAIQLVRTCENTNVKPIIGNEMYIVDQIPDPTLDDAPPVKRYHLIVLAKNTIGYRNLVKLTTLAHLHGKVGKGIFARPCITKEQLAIYREGLIVSSACLGGEIPQAILNDDLKKARASATWFRDTFADDFYLEIQDHGSEEDKKVNPVMVQLSNELGIKVIATNDSHFTDCMDAEAHDAMICIQTGKVLSDDNRLHYAGNEYFKSVEEMRKCFVDHLPLEAVDDALYNTIGVAAKVESYDLFGATRIPDFPIPSKFRNSHNDYLRHVAAIGLEERFEARARSGLVDPMLRDVYLSRLEIELDLLCSMGFSSYFLVVWDYIKYAKELGIPVGPGRGSAAGSLVAFALRITDVDPIPFNLLFERFLNPERKSMPDIDTDFSVQGREKIISYVSERYGEGRVAQIITFNRLTSKAVLKDVARVHEVPYSEADKLAKLIPVVRGKPAKLTQLMSDDSPSPDFKAAIDRNPSYQTWLEKAKRIEGANKTYGIHAAGVVISATPLTDIVPLSKAKHGEIITQYAMDDVEALGLLKMDFLGLKNLSVIETALKFINEGRRSEGLNQDLDFSVDALPLDDAKTYKLLAEGELDGIFQLDASAGMRSIVHELRPSNLEDISSVLALYRPGPLDAGLIPKFIRRKHGIDPIEYDHPMLEPILKETYGIMVYQEQIMRIARDMAGYSLGQADILRRAMGKKKMADMEREKPRFIEGAKKNGVPVETSTKLFEMMTKFAEYCFNKSHSTAYAYLTYQTAYLKANYPVEYAAALLRLNMNQSDKLVRYLADANAMGVRVLPPCVNKSELGFTVDRSGSDGPVVLFGLEAVKAVGESVATALLEERIARGPFVNIVDLIERVNLRVLNKRAMGALILAGAFDSLHSNRKILSEHLDSLLALRRKLRDRRRRRESKKISEEQIAQLDEDDRQTWEEAEIQLMQESSDQNDFDMLERLAGEKSTLGFYASGNPLFNLQGVAKALGCTKVHHLVGDLSESGEANSEDTVERVSSQVPDGTDVMILSCVTDLKKMTTARGKKMAKWLIEDATGRIPGIVFPSEYELMEQVLPSTEEDPENDAPESTAEQRFVVEEDARVIVWGKVQRESSGSTQVIIDDVQRVEDVQAVAAITQYSTADPPSSKLFILQHMAARIMEVSLSPDQVGTFVDKNGETRRRRRKKQPPLEYRNRIPLVLQCVDENGDVVVGLNAGNSLRFPKEAGEWIQRLRSKTDFDFRVISVRKDLLSEELITSNDAHAEPRIGLNQELANAQKLAAFKPAVPAEDETSELSLESSFNSPEIESVAEGSLSSIVENTVNELTSTTQGNTLDALPIIEEIDSAEVQKMEIKVPKHDIIPRGRAQDTVQVGDIVLSPSEHEEYLSTLDALNEKDVSYSDGVAEEALAYMRSSMYRPDVFSTKAFSNFRGIGEFAVHDAFQGKSPPPPVSESTESGHALSSISSNSISTGVVMKTSPISQAMLSPTEVNESLSSPVDYNSVNAHSFLDSASPTTLPGKPNNTVDSLDFADVGGEILRQNLDSMGVDRGVGGNQSGEAIGRSHGSRHFSDDSHTNGGSASGLTPDLARDVASELSMRHAAADQRSIDLNQVESKGLDVNVSDAKLAGVIDAVCLVAGTVASKLTDWEHAITGISKMNLEKLIGDDLTLRVTGKVVYAEEHDVYVLVDIRETEPTGKRKRVRSFGPVAVSLTTEKKLEATTLKTKISKKNLDAFVQKMRTCAESEEVKSSPSSDESKPKTRKNTSVQVRSSEAGFVMPMDLPDGEDNAVYLRDGGELLVWMSRAAEVCAGNALQDLKRVCATSLECAGVENARLIKSVESVTIRTHLLGCSFGTLRVQADAQLYFGDGECMTVGGTFVVGSVDGRNLKVGVIDDEVALFDNNPVTRVCAGVEERISSVL